MNPPAPPWSSEGTDGIGDGTGMEGGVAIGGIYGGTGPPVYVSSLPEGMGFKSSGRTPAPLIILGVMDIKISVSSFLSPLAVKRAPTSGMSPKNATFEVDVLSVSEMRPARTAFSLSFSLKKVSAFLLLVVNASVVCPCD